MAEYVDNPDEQKEKANMKAIERDFENRAEEAF